VVELFLVFISVKQSESYHCRLHLSEVLHNFSLKSVCKESQVEHLIHDIDEFLDLPVLLIKFVSVQHIHYSKYFRTLPTVKVRLYFKHLISQVFVFFHQDMYLALKSVYNLSSIV